MKKILLMLIAVISITVACKTSKSTTAVENENTEVSGVPYEKLDKALLWEISGNGLETSSYLYGTIHIIPTDDYFLPKGTLEAIGSSEKMVFEIDMKDMNNMMKQLGMLNSAFMKDGLTLKDLYTDEEYKIVKTYFDEMGLPIFFLERLKPMFLTVFASGDIDPQDLQNGEAKSYEMEFFDMAKDSKMKTGGLETIEYQMSVFDSIPYEDQAEILLETIQMGDTGGASFQQMVDVYKMQDIEGMQTMFEEEEGGIEGHEDVLLINRNKNWIPIMGDYMKEGPTFFAVGAGHLAGSFGVIHLLKEAGYTLTPLSKE